MLKLCTTVFDPSTLFIKDNKKALRVLTATKRTEKENMGEHTCTSIRCLGHSTYADSVCESLARSLSEAETESPTIGEVAFFRLGDLEGAVHLEPRSDTDRIFVNVIPGTAEHLRSLMEKLGMGFPWAWCFGMPVWFVGSDEAESFDGARKLSLDKL
jgi:hypothetical protein